jgi:hypothetical protein
MAIYYHDVFVSAKLYQMFHEHVFQDFLKHLLKEAKKDTEVTEEKLIEYTDTMVR